MLTQVFSDLAGLLPLESQVLPNGNSVLLHENSCYSEVSKEQEGLLFSLYSEQLL